MSQRLAASVVLVLAGSLNSSSLAAQQVIPDEVACGGCSLRWVVELRLGDGEGPGLVVGRPRHVSRDSRGRYWVTYQRGGELVGVYSNTGQFLGQVGSRGGGPGEFSAPAFTLPIPGDSVLVFDDRLLRATVVDPDLRPSRTIRVPNATFYSAVVEEWPAVLLNGIVRTSGGYGRPFHVVDLSDPEADIIRSFGSSGDQNERMTDRTEYKLLHRIAPAGAGSFWAARGDLYRLQLIGPQGASLKDLVREPPWFESESAFGIGSPEIPPPPGLDALLTDADGLLWTFVHVPRADWASGWPKLPPGTGPISISAEALDVEKLWRTTVEVIDPDMGRVLVRGDLDRVVVSVLSDGSIIVYEETDLGIPYILVMKAVLSRH